MSGRERLTATLADRYRIERELGSGGMATVFLARDLRHDRVAIKMLRASPRQPTKIGASIAHFIPWSPDGKYLYLRNGDAAATPTRIVFADGAMEPVFFRGGSHMSLNPAGTVVSDVVGHRWLWTSPLGGEPDSTFAAKIPLSGWTTRSGRPTALHSVRSHQAGRW